jgi:pyrimidine operon attenuation protein/uracil phosphoribosyltransferase
MKKYIIIINENHIYNDISKIECNNIEKNTQIENILIYGKLKSLSLYNNIAFEK